MDRWFSAAACLLALVSAGFALWAASIEIGTVRDSLDHFIFDLASATEARRVQSFRNVMSASAAILAAASNMIALGIRHRG